MKLKLMTQDQINIALNKSHNKSALTALGVILLLIWMCGLTIKCYNNHIPTRDTSQNTLNKYKEIEKQWYDNGWNAGVSWKTEADLKIINGYQSQAAVAGRVQASHDLAITAKDVREKTHP